MANKQRRMREVEKHWNSPFCLKPVQWMLALRVQPFLGNLGKDCLNACVAACLFQVHQKEGSAFFVLPAPPLRKSSVGGRYFLRS